VLRADNLTTFMCRVSRNSGASASGNPKGLSKPVAGKLYLFTSRATRNTTGLFASQHQVFHTAVKAHILIQIDVNHLTYIQHFKYMCKTRIHIYEFVSFTLCPLLHTTSTKLTLFFPLKKCISVLKYQESHPPPPNITFVGSSPSSLIEAKFAHYFRECYWINLKHTVSFETGK
jgi:hypothetical protein